MLLDGLIADALTAMLDDRLAIAGDGLATALDETALLEGLGEATGASDDAARDDELDRELGLGDGDRLLA